MNKNGLIREVARSSGLTLADARRAVDAIFGTVSRHGSKDGAIVRALLRNREVALTGFGVFESVETDARLGHNLTTGQRIMIPAGRKPKFRFGKYVKEQLKAKYQKGSVSAVDDDPMIEDDSPLDEDSADDE